MKRFTERVVLMSVTVLILSCVANSVGQPSGVPSDCNAAASGTIICSLVFESGATTDNMFRPQNDWLDDHAFTVRGVAAVQPNGRSRPVGDAPASNSLAVADNTARATTLMGVKIVSTGLGANLEPTLNSLAPQHRAFPGPVRPLSLDQPATPSTSSANANGPMNFQIVGSLVQPAPKIEYQARHIEGMSTRAWTTIAGWHPRESAFPDAGTDEPESDLISLAF